MSKLQDIQSSIASLSQAEYVQIRQWFAERDWGKWDEAIEGDSMSGKLDFLIDEAATEKARGQLLDL